MKPVTVRDVARMAGVSTATVSRVLSGHGERVQEPTRQKVIQAADQLGYQPSSLPQMMRRGRSNAFGVVVSDIENPFFTAVIRGCEREAHDLGYRVVLINTDENDLKEEAALHALASDRIAGVVLASTGKAHRGTLSLRSVGAPVVAIDNNLAGTAVDLVKVDNVEAARRALAHLMSLGHKRITMLSGPEYPSSIQEREWGFRQETASLQNVGEYGSIVRGDLREAGAYAASLSILTAPDPPTAIFSVNNMSTMGLLRAINDLQVRIPSDLSVVGFDDIPLGTVLRPPLTAIAQPTEEIGRTAVQLLVWRLQNEDASPVQRVLRTDFHVRGSTGPPPAPDRTSLGSGQ